MTPFRTVWPGLWWGKKRKKDGKMVLTHERSKAGIWKIKRKKKR
jgi:hypothetical protein